jgi:hypothetical protein
MPTLNQRISQATDALLYVCYFEIMLPKMHIGDEYFLKSVEMDMWYFENESRCDHAM